MPRTLNRYTVAPAPATTHQGERTQVDTVIRTLEAHPELLLGVVAGVVVTTIIHLIRRVRRLIVTGAILAMAGGGAAGGVAPLLQNLLHLH